MKLKAVSSWSGIRNGGEIDHEVNPVDVGEDDKEEDTLQAEDEMGTFEPMQHTSMERLVLQ
jgi:hypothetical protein